MNNNANFEVLVKALSALGTAQPDGSLVITFGDAASVAPDNDQVDATPKSEMEEQTESTRDSAADMGDGEIYEVVAKRLNDVMDELTGVQADFYEFIKTRMYRNVAFNVPKCEEHLFTVLDCANRMEKLMNRVTLTSNTLDAMGEIVGENAPDELLNILAQVAVEFNKTYTLIAPQNELMQSKMTCVFCGE